MSITRLLMFLLAAASSGSGQNETCLSTNGIQDMRLVNGRYGDSMGRVEIRVSGTWGTVCDDSWSLDDADVTCRMMGFRGAVCAVGYARFGRGSSSSPIWLTNARCTGDEDCLDDCSYSGITRRVTSCGHYEDAGVVCMPDQLVSPPTISLHNSTTTSLTISFQSINTSSLPQGVNTRVRYRLSYSKTDGERPIRRNSYFYSYTSSRSQQVFMTISSLERDTEYSVQFGVDFRYTFYFCSSYVIGPLSQALLLQTNATKRQSNVPIRLVPSRSNSGLNFTGRVEVQYNGTWGTVCDNGFGTDDANLICKTLNYTGSLCIDNFSSNYGTGTIWLNQLRCPVSAEVIEDCSHSGWGNNRCRHSDDVSIVCNPGEEYLGTVTNVVVTDVRSDRATIQWEPRTLQGLSISYEVLFKAVTRSSRSLRTTSSSRITLIGLRLGVTYNVVVRPRARIRCSRWWYSSAYAYFSGIDSEAVNFTTFIPPPTGPPTNFHVVVLNSTAVEVFWDAPLRSHQNGDITGYVLFYMGQGGSENQIEYSDTDLDVAVIVNGLTPSTEYTFSVIAVNVGGQGPRSIHLSGQTFAEGTEPIINRFGINGNGLDRAVQTIYRRNLNIHCGTTRSNVQIDWFTPSGEKVGITDRNLREGHYANGTTVLQIAAFRRLNSCDGGVYTCVANDSISGYVHRKSFTLIIGSSPLRPNRVSSINRTSTSLKVGWEAPTCDGGHKIIEYNLQYSRGFFSSGRIVQYHIEATNFTVDDLSPDTRYTVQVQAVTSDLRVSSWSPSRYIWTLPEAPSSPKNITVRIVDIRMIEVAWTRPAVSNGEIFRYTVYLTPFSQSGSSVRRRRQTDEPTDTSVIIATFPGTQTAGNITVPTTGVTYGVQVTAATQIGDELNEGQLSTLTSFEVTEPEIPYSQNLRLSQSANSSITIKWDLPQHVFIDVNEIIVNYTSNINWKSPMGEDVQLTESGSVSVSASENSVRISPLTPGTTYQFKVAANTEAGIGQASTLVASTTGGMNEEGRVAFFQIKFGPVDKCSSFQVGDTDKRLSEIKAALIEEINDLCSCGLTVENIRNSVFSCGDRPVQQVFYRARILGNEKYNARDLVLLVQSWVQSGRASINAGLFRFNIDSTCTTNLDTLRSPSCEIKLDYTTTQNSPQSGALSGGSAAQPSGISSGEIVTIIVGLIIIGVLICVVVLLVVVLLKRRRSSNNIILGNMKLRSQVTKQEDELPFANLEQRNEVEAKVDK